MFLAGWYNCKHLSVYWNAKNSLLPAVDETSEMCFSQTPRNYQAELSSISRLDNFAFI